VMSGVFLRYMISDVKKGALTFWRKLGGTATFILFVWHVYSGVYYVSHLLTTNNAF